MPTAGGLLTTTLSKIETGGHPRPTWQREWLLHGPVDCTFPTGAGLRLSKGPSLSNAMLVLRVWFQLLKDTPFNPD